MMIKTYRIVFTLLLLVASCLVSGQNFTTVKPVVRKAAFFDKTEPLRDMKIVLRGTRDRSWKEGVIDNKTKDETSLYQNRTNKTDINTIQREKGTQINKGPVMNFPGIGKGTSSPSDSNGDIGPNHYFQMVNLSFAIWDRTGNLLYGPVDNSTLWDGFIGSWTGTNDGDPIVIYDDLANRWVATQFAVDTDDGTYWQLIAVSETEDPLGSYYRYAYQFEIFNDYPKFSVWPDGYYSTYNMFDNDFEGAVVAVMDRDAMVSGDPDAAIVTFGPFPAQYGLKSAHLEGQLPPEGAPNWLVNLKKFGQQSLEVYKLEIDWHNPLNSTYTLVDDLAVASFDFFNPGVREQLVQPNTEQLLDPLSKYLMNPLQYRNFGNYESMVVNHTVKVGDVAGIRWYELRKDEGQDNWYLYQQGTYCPEDGLNRWMASVAINGNGDIALGYTLTGESVFPSLAYTGRSINTPPGEMDVAEIVVVEGTHSQTNSARWGDYSSMAIDPLDDLSFWFTGEYMPSSNWGTRVLSFDLGPIQPPTAFAGYDNEICNQQIYHAHGTATSQKNVSWVSLGDGNLFNDNTLNPAYVRGMDDIENGRFELVMTAYGFEAGLEASDTVCVEIVDDVVISLGNDTTILVNNSLQLLPHVSNADSLLWSTSGDGVFSNDTIIDPYYTPGGSDIINGEVTISLYGKSIPPCEGEDEDDMIVYIDEFNSIDKYDNTPQLKIYPNPTRGIVNFEIQGLSDMSFSLNVLTENGTAIFSREFSGSAESYTNSFNFSYLPDGIYFVSVGNGVNKVIRKIILEK